MPTAAFDQSSPVEAAAAGTVFRGVADGSQPIGA